MFAPLRTPEKAEKCLPPYKATVLIYASLLRILLPVIPNWRVQPVCAGYHWFLLWLLVLVFYIWLLVMWPHSSTQPITNNQIMSLLFIGYACLRINPPLCSTRPTIVSSHWPDCVLNKPIFRPMPLFPVAPVEISFCCVSLGVFSLVFVPSCPSA